MTLDLSADRQWLDVEIAGKTARLFTAEIGRVKATYNFNARTFARVIGQYFSGRRDPRLYDTAVQRREASFPGSVLFGYRLNWQSVAFLGYGDDRARVANGGLASTGRAIFCKVSYAWQR